MYKNEIAVFNLFASSEIFEASDLRSTRPVLRENLIFLWFYLGPNWMNFLKVFLFYIMYGIMLNWHIDLKSRRALCNVNFKKSVLTVKPRIIFVATFGAGSKSVKLL